MFVVRIVNMRHQALFRPFPNKRLKFNLTMVPDHGLLNTLFNLLPCQLDFLMYKSLRSINQEFIYLKVWNECCLEKIWSSWFFVIFYLCYSLFGNAHPFAINSSFGKFISLQATVPNLLLSRSHFWLPLRLFFVAISSIENYWFQDAFWSDYSCLLFGPEHLNTLINIFMVKIFFTSFLQL